ncbi:MAG: glycosyl hydrolase family 28-related protein [Pseudomonadota bacterium]|nr:glycosyl hydrolase family 28-related protein [Pseudomonadota bacterium]MEC8665891.1 glycosyl hydrolase family 28-related protein [Pseudomonadota bacterium]
MTTEHIKMPDVAPLVRYVADGEQTVYSYPFPIFASEDIAVYFDGAAQVSGFTVGGAGQTSGGTVTFATAPTDGVVVTLERRLPLERLTDFLEGGDFSAQAINNELDFLIAAIQQVGSDQTGMLRYTSDEAPATVELPTKTQRANKVLGFDGSGNPVAVSTEGTMAAPDFTASGTGATARSSSDKFSDLISVKDFGAVGDGLTDDTLAIQQALAAHNNVFIPEGTFLITSAIALTDSQALIGAGQSCVIKCQSNSFNAITVAARFTRIANLRIEGGLVGIDLQGGVNECVQNAVTDVNIVGAVTGIKLDGGASSLKPCYWNNFNRILIEQPALHGVYLTLSGAGDTPNANRFYSVRIFSKGASTTGSGFYIEDGALNNAFIDCEANVNGATADSCFRVGAGANKTLMINLLTESSNSVPNVKLDSGSLETSIFNLSAESDGSAILDNSGGNYDAFNAGYPNKNRMRKTTVTDLTATLMRFDTEYIDTPGTTALDLSHSIHIVDATSGAITVELPTADSAAGVSMTVKKKDGTSNIVSITEGTGGGGGPDGSSLQLGGEDDYATMISNGAQWLITSSNRMAGNTRYIDSSGTIDIDMAVDTYLLSSFGGAMTARLPPANASEAVGRTITIKKTDSSANAITVTEQGGAGPDQSSQSLSSQYNAITVVSNGGQWYVVNKYS